MSTDTAGFPPRAGLPRGLQQLVERLPFLGTTWYERGARYWVRRAGYTLFWVLLLTLETTILGGLFAFIRSSTQLGFYIALGIEIVICLGTGGYMWARLRRQAEGLWKPPLGRRTAGRRAGTSGAAAGLLAGAGSAAGQAFLLAGAVLSYGAFAAYFLRSFLPVLDHERPVRHRLAEVLHARGYDLPIS